MAASIKHKKWITYGLGALVALVWGIILQRIFATAEPDAKVSLVRPIERGNVKARLPVLQPDTSKLLLNYKDPFGAVSVPAGPAEAVGALPPTVSALPRPPVLLTDPLDGVVYLGYILNPKTNKRVAILQVDGKEQMVMEGRLVGQIRLLQIETDAIWLSHKNKRKHIKRKL